MGEKIPGLRLLTKTDCPSEMKARFKGREYLHTQGTYGKTESELDGDMRREQRRPKKSSSLPKKKEKSA